MSIFERYLTIWVALCIVAGVALGHFLPGVFQIIGGAEIAKVNLPVAILIWLMIIPMLVNRLFQINGYTICCQKLRSPGPGNAA